MLDTHDPLTQIKITSVACSSVAVSSAVFRLYVRRGRLWWDDAWAFFSMLSQLVQIAAVFMHMPSTSDMSQLNRVAAYYLMSASFYSIIWSARLSIIFSVIRIDPSEYRRRRLLAIAALFALIFLALLIQLFWICEREPNWKNLATPQCDLGLTVAVSQLVSDVIADSLLLAAPLKLLAGLEDKGLRRRLILIFSTCIATTIVSLVHAVYILENKGTQVIIAALVENGISLMVCNIPVVITATVRLRDQSENGRRRTRGPQSTFLKFATRNRTMRSTMMSSIPDLDPKTTNAAFDGDPGSTSIMLHKSRSSENGGDTLSADDSLSPEEGKNKVGTWTELSHELDVAFAI